MGDPAAFNIYFATGVKQSFLCIRFILAGVKPKSIEGAGCTEPASDGLRLVDCKTNAFRINLTAAIVAVDWVVVATLSNS